MKRRSFIWAGVAAIGAVGIAYTQRNPIARWFATRRQNEGVTLTDAIGVDAPSCVLADDQAEGPYYFESPERRDIRENREGKALALNLQVVRADGCTPVPGAEVAVWHCDAAGRYSGYPEALARDFFGTMALAAEYEGERVPPTNGTTYLRGMQKTDGAGIARFDTIVPGWYEPRVPHIHVKVVAEGKSYLTTQLYFPEGLTSALYRQHASYSPHGESPYNVANDFVLGEFPNATGLLLQPLARGDDLVASAKLGIG